ncbi:MAG: hypothetical protein U0234_02830 [Sandaracinus sp.]
MDMLRCLGPAALLAIATSAAGCGYPTNVQAGGACQRTAQCGAGLVCSQGVCTNDLTMFGMGHPTSLDTGLVDGGMGNDASYYDANLPDTGVPNDAFTPPNDAFTPPNDAFTPPNDAFTPPNDAFTPPDDAWVDPNDAWVDPGNDAG